MRGKDFNTGLRGVLFEARHYERMGSAVWLYAWLVLRQTHQTGATGWVLGGAPVSYREIEEETGFNVRTLERWMSALRRCGYIQTKAVMGGLIVRITKAKKHGQARNSAEAGNVERLRRASERLRKLAGGVRNCAEGDTQDCVAGGSELSENTQLPLRISSSSVEESIKRNTNRDENRNPQDFERQQQNLTPSRSGEMQKRNLNELRHETRNLFAEPGRVPRVRVQEPRTSWLAIAEARLQQERMRAERDNEVRRELFVGAGPEIRTEVRTKAQKTAAEAEEGKR
ncbi:MAG TPA: hypothetical protein VNK23_12580 [Candidatus Dormibacteraeota bacterium]|nr:hypothetical protein [Candidatus Dormibacteraeota bacterium]